MHRQKKIAKLLWLSNLFTLLGYLSFYLFDDVSYEMKHKILNLSLILKIIIAEKTVVSLNANEKKYIEQPNMYWHYFTLNNKAQFLL